MTEQQYCRDAPGCAELHGDISSLLEVVSLIVCLGTRSTA